METMQRPNLVILGSKSGGPGGNRTPDALLRTEALYPLSYEAANCRTPKPTPEGPNTKVWPETPRPNLTKTHHPKIEPQTRQSSSQLTLRRHGLTPPIRRTLPKP